MLHFDELNIYQTNCDEVALACPRIISHKVVSEGYIKAVLNYVHFTTRSIVDNSDLIFSYELLVQLANLTVFLHVALFYFS